MNLKEIDLKHSYESDCGDLIELFYEPVLNCAIKYCRLAGFFSSSSLAIAARGLSSFIKRGGKYLLVCNPKLSNEDAKAINDSIESIQENISLDFDNLSNEFERNHVKALGWMLANGYLEIKLAIIYDENGNAVSGEDTSKYGIFHQKVGILTDSEGNSISFSGSINESATAWLNNDEEFKVFRSWDASKHFVDSDLKRFQSYWCDEKNKTRIYNLPDAVKNKLIEFSEDFDIESISVQKYLALKKGSGDYSQSSSIPLFGYQQDALNKWISNGYQLLFEMATGTGKTRTAIACVSYLLANYRRLLVVVSCPQSTLARQWGKEFDELKVKTDRRVIVDSTNPQWRSKLNDALLELDNGFIDTLLVLTTHASSSKEDFINAIESVCSGTTSVFVGDETHWLGAKKLRNALLNSYKYRIGLSATPSRWYDDLGTQHLINYYGNDNFEFSIFDALTTINPFTGKTFLVNYMYHLIPIMLDEEEGMEYKKLTRQLIRAFAIKDNSDEANDKYQRLLIKRADLVKNADAKFIALENLLRQMEDEDNLRDLIIFVSPQQKERVKEILNRRNIMSHELTEKQGTSKKIEFGGKSEREHIIQCFKDGRYKVIVAIKCLDEGIDIPTASRGIIMASSTNPREYIQRIGRIIRQSHGKTRSHLYDMSVLGCEYLSEEENNIDKKLREKEVIRIREIAKNALNSYDAELIINNYK